MSHSHSQSPHKASAIGGSGASSSAGAGITAAMRTRSPRRPVQQTNTTPMSNSQLPPTPSSSSLVAASPHVPATPFSPSNSSVPPTPSSVTGSRTHNAGATDNAGFSDLKALFGNGTVWDDSNDLFDDTKPEEDADFDPDALEDESDEEDDEEEEEDEDEDEEEEDEDGNEEEDAADASGRDSIAESTQSEQVARRTRARVPMQNVALDELEKLLPANEWEDDEKNRQPFSPSAQLQDGYGTSLARHAHGSQHLHPSQHPPQSSASTPFSPQPHETPSSQVDDDQREYRHFLSMLENSNMEADDDDDEEFQLEQDEQEEEEEEYRNDRSVSISKKELRALRKDREKNLEPYLLPSTSAVNAASSSEKRSVMSTRRKEGKLMHAATSNNLSLPHTSLQNASGRGHMESDIDMCAASTFPSTSSLPTAGLYSESSVAFPLHSGSASQASSSFAGDKVPAGHHRSTSATIRHSASSSDITPSFFASAHSSIPTTLASNNQQRRNNQQRPPMHQSAASAINLNAVAAAAAAATNYNSSYDAPLPDLPVVHTPSPAAASYLDTSHSIPTAAAIAIPATSAATMATASMAMPAIPFNGSMSNRIMARPVVPTAASGPTLSALTPEFVELMKLMLPNLSNAAAPPQRAAVITTPAPPPEPVQKPVAQADWSDAQRSTLHSQLSAHVQLLVQVRYLTVNYVLAPLPRPVRSNESSSQQQPITSATADAVDPPSTRMKASSNFEGKPLMTLKQIWQGSGDLLSELIKKRDTAESQWKRKQEEAKQRAAADAEDPFSNPSAPEFDSRPILATLPALDTWYEMSQKEEIEQSFHDMQKLQSNLLPIRIKREFAALKNEEVSSSELNNAQIKREAERLGRPWNHSTQWFYTPLLYEFYSRDTQSSLDTSLRPRFDHHFSRRVFWTKAEDNLLAHGVRFFAPKTPRNPKTYIDWARLGHRFLPARTLEEMKVRHYNQLLDAKVRAQRASEQGSHELYEGLTTADADFQYEVAGESFQRLRATEDEEEQEESKEESKDAGADSPIISRTSRPGDNVSKNAQPRSTSIAPAVIGRSPAAAATTSSAPIPVTVAASASAPAANRAPVVIVPSQAASGSDAQTELRQLVLPRQGIQGVVSRELTADEAERLEQGLARFPESVKKRWKCIVETYLPDWDRLSLRRAYIRMEKIKQFAAQGKTLQVHKPRPKANKELKAREVRAANARQVMNAANAQLHSHAAQVAASAMPGSFDEVDLVDEERSSVAESRSHASRQAHATAAAAISESSMHAAIHAANAAYPATAAATTSSAAAHQQSQFDELDIEEEEVEEEAKEEKVDEEEEEWETDTPVARPANSGVAPMELDDTTKPSVPPPISVDPKTSSTALAASSSASAGRVDDRHLADAIVALRTPEVTTAASVTPQHPAAAQTPAVTSSPGSTMTQPSLQRSISQLPRSSLSPQFSPSPMRAPSAGASSTAPNIHSLAHTSELVQTVPPLLLAPVSQQLTYTAEQYAYASSQPVEGRAGSPAKRPARSTSIARSPPPPGSVSKDSLGEPMHKRLRTRTPDHRATVAAGSPAAAAAAAAAVTSSPAAATSTVLTVPSTRPPRSARLFAEHTIRQQAQLANTDAWTKLHQPATPTPQINHPAPAAVGESPTKKQRLSEKENQ